MSKKLLSLLFIPFLASCAYIDDKSIQDITIYTPGAEDAVCNMYIEGVRYRAHPPQTISIFNSSEDLVIDCMAPGNRRQKLEIPSRRADSAHRNIATLGVGYAWDYASGALFKYPDTIEINFIDEPIGKPLIPAQNNPDIRQPEDYALEEFKPGQPRLNSDKYRQPPELIRRDGRPVRSGQTIQNTGAEAKASSLNLDPMTNAYFKASEKPSQQPTSNASEGTLNVYDLNPAGDTSSSASEK